MKPRKTLCTARTTTALALYAVALVLALAGCPWWAWFGPVNAASLLYWDVI